MKLIHKDGREVKVGDKVKSSREESAVIIAIEKPRHGGSTGRVYVEVEGMKGTMAYFPSVYDLQWIEREDQ